MSNIAGPAGHQGNAERPEYLEEVDGRTAAELPVDSPDRAADDEDPDPERYVGDPVDDPACLDAGKE